MYIFEKVCTIVFDAERLIKNLSFNHKSTCVQIIHYVVQIDQINKCDDRQLT